MKKFKVTITETLQQVITVTAIDPCEAEEKVEAEWNNQDHILDADNFVGVEFTAVPVMMRVMTMVHKDWCGNPCGECESPCRLDEAIPCSPDCDD